MKLSVAIQMDPINNLNLKSDSTLRLAWEAKRRNYQLYYYTPNQLEFYNGEVRAYLSKLNVTPENISHCEAEPYKLISLTEMDVILIRQDPPFNMNYLTTTYLLELISNQTLIVNNPTEIRNCPEKLFLNNFPNLIVKTLITSNKKQIEHFLEEQEEIILKPLYAFGGKDVFYLKKDDANFKPIYEHLIKTYNDSLIAQQYIPEVIKGDKRIILANGKAIGAVLRKPAPNEVRANFAAGGSGVKTELTDRDLEICNTIAPELKRRGIIIAGIDVIGDYITEINITSPTGIAIINELNNVSLEAKIWDEIENSLSVI